MLLSIRTSILTVAAFTAFTAPVLAAGTTAVTPPISQAVKSPPTVAPAKPEAAKTAPIVPPAAKAAPIVAPAKPEVVKEMIKAAPAVPAARNEHPDNEQLAVQITKLRLNVIGLDREMTDVKKEIRKMKVTLARNGRPVRVAANSKGRKHMAKRGHHHAAAHATTKKTARLHAGATKTSKATLTLPPAPPAM